MSLQHLFIACLFLVTVVLRAGPVMAVENDISFEADSVTVNQDDDMLAVGNVEMKQAGMTLTADEVRLIAGRPCSRQGQCHLC